MAGARPHAGPRKAAGARPIGDGAGDFNDRASLDRALEGAYGAFSVQDFWETGYEMEVPQGRNVADADAAAGVQHLVYSSAGGADRNTGIPHFQSKWQIEQLAHFRSAVAKAVPAPYRNCFDHSFWLCLRWKPAFS